MKTSDKDLNKNSTIQRILDLLEKKNIKQKELANYLGISTSIFTNWKYRNGNSYMNYLDKIATFLNLEFPGILLTVASNDPRKFKGRWKSQIVPIHPYIFPLIFSTTFISINSSI